MAGQIQDPLDFRVDSFQSGSISFGRFESEVLCWERRSSFSHNRYLEEVEKCSKPGSVIQKKAYFEARLRKKGSPVLSPPECRDETDHVISQTDNSDKTCHDEEVDHTSGSICSAQFDESLDGSVHGLDHEVMGCEIQAFGPQFELASDVNSSVECIPQHVNVDKAHDAELNMANEENLNSTPKGLQSSSTNEKIRPKLDNTGPRLVPRVSVKQSRRGTSKSSENKANNNVVNVPVRSKAGKKAPEDSKKPLMQRYERGSKPKVDGINSAEKGLRNRTITEPQPSTSRKVSTTAYQNANRIKPAFGISKPVTRDDTSKSSSISNERAQIRKKAIPSNNEPQKQRAKASIPGIRLPEGSPFLARASARRRTDDPPEASVTSDSNASSFARTSKYKPSLAGISRKKEPEKEKLTSVHKHKVPELGNPIHKGKTYDGKQRPIIRSTYGSLNSSSRSGRMAIGVAS